MEDKEKEFFENLIKAEVENTVKISMNTQLMPKIEELKNLIQTQKKKEISRENNQQSDMYHRNNICNT